MNVDSYTVTVEAPGYQTENIAGVIVFGDETDSANATLQKQLKTIAHVTARSVASAYQPSQTVDSYTVNKAQMLQSTGNPNSTDESAVLLSVPGVTMTNAGTVTIRGGAAYEVGYQYDGVTFKEPFLGGNGSMGLMNGLGSVQVVEGAGDATQGGVGAGVINVIPQRGSGPGTGSVDFQVGGPNFDHQMSFNYGFSTPDNRISEYFGYTGQRYAPYLGYSTTPLNQYGDQYATTYQSNNQFVNNLFYNFGKNNHETLQMLYTNVSQEGYQGFYGPGYEYYPYDFNPSLATGEGTQFLYGSNGPGGGVLTGLTESQYSSLVGLAPGTPGVNETITTPQQNFSNNTEFLKFEYDNRINPSTYLAVRYYNWNSLQSADGSYTNGAWQTGTPGLTVGAETTGGYTSGFSADLEHQFGSNLTVSLEGQYNILHPLFDLYEPQLQLLTPVISDLPNQIAPTDWVTGGYFCTNGYLSCPNGVANTRVPSWGINYNKTFFDQWGTGLRFQYSPTDALKFDLGVRDEGQVQHWYNQLSTIGQATPSIGYLSSCAYPIATANPTATSAQMAGLLAATCASSPVTNPFDVASSSWTNRVLRPTELQPRLAASFEINRYNSVRFGYGRSAVFADAQTAGTPFATYGLGAYTNIPAKPGSLCGWSATLVFPCANAAQQLYWAGDNVEAPDAGNGTPAIYSNYDLSFNHLFKNGWGTRVTGFDKLGTDLPSFFIINPVLGIFGVGNQGLNKTAGVELNVTTPERPLGVSGFFTATYQNVLTTTPPFTFAETTVPIVPNASLALHDLYRAGYVSPFDIRVGALDNLKNGFTISPQLEFNIGYPYTVGNMIAGQLSDGSYANIPQVDFGPGITGGLTSLIGTNPGSAVSTNYYDPAYPGSAFNPNIAATRGTPGTAANGGKLSHANLTADLTLQWKHGPNTLGIQLMNLFGNAFVGAVPSVNPYYQPVANGISGPQTGYNTCVGQVGAGQRGCYPYLPRDTYAFANGAYVLTNGNFSTATPTFAPLQPFTVQVYYTRAL